MLHIKCHGSIDYLFNEMKIQFNLWFCFIFSCIISVTTEGLRQERPPHLRGDHIHPAMIERGRAIPNTQSVPIINDKPQRAHDHVTIIDGRVSRKTTKKTTTTNSKLKEFEFEQMKNVLSPIELIRPWPILQISFVCLASLSYYPKECEVVYDRSSFVELKFMIQFVSELFRNKMTWEQCEYIFYRGHFLCGSLITFMNAVCGSRWSY